MSFAAQAITRAGSGIQASAGYLRQVRDRLIAELRLTVDLDRWTRSSSWSDRFAAVSWPRVAIIAAFSLTVIGGGYAIQAMFRPDAYPPPMPTAQQIEARRLALLNAPRVPPPGLVEANKSWKAK
tara:strand:+ start:215 stop:589 length:375 start_codon:yes stop_codon:yes gene_type:complete